MLRTARTMSSLLARSLIITASVFAVGMVGCAGMGGGGGVKTATATGQPKPKKLKPEEMSAPDAWVRFADDSRNKSIWGKVGNIVMSAGGGRGGASAAQTGGGVEGVLKTSNEEVERQMTSAMSGDLPGRAVDAMVDEVAQKLVTDLGEIPAVKAAEHQFYLAFGSLNNSEQTMQAVDAMKEKLFNNEKVGESFMIVNSSEADSSQLIKKVAGGDLHVFRDPLGRSLDETKAKTLDPKYIYFVSGNLYSSKDMPKRSITVTMTWRVEHLQTRKLERNLQFKRTYMWHPYRKDWELQP